MAYEHVVPVDAGQLATELGAPLFTTDLHMPDYAVGDVGRWKLTRTGFCLDRGYHSGLWTVQGMPVLMRNRAEDGEEWETWMSLSPHEIESQELACRYATGHTVVMGLGMGWVAINIALNPRVERVTVIELDTEVIDLFDQSRVLMELPAEVASKIQVVHGDALEWQPRDAVDFLYADIWRAIEEPQALDDVRRMQANVQADLIYFWGQELVIHALWELDPKSGMVTRQAVEQCVDERMALPLLLPNDFDYPALIAEVVRRRRERMPMRARSQAKPVITLRRITEDDMEFLFQLYASTRAEEKAMVGWTEDQWEAFLRDQFRLQHTQYMRNYLNPSFDIILKDSVEIGRLYVDRREDEIRLIDVAVLPGFRRQGVVAHLIKALLEESAAKGLPITLHVESNNPILDYYRRLGFETQEDKEVYLFMKRSPTTGSPSWGSR